MPVRAEDLPGTAAPADPSPPPGQMIVGRFDQRPPYAVHRPRGADSWLFTWTTGGAGLLRQGTARTRATPGDLVVLGPGVPQHYAVGPGAGHWAFWWVHCQPRASWTAWLRPYESGDRLYAVPSAPGGIRERVEAAFRRMLADARWTGDGAPPAPAPPGDEHTDVAVAHGTAARELALCSLEEVVLLTAARSESRPSGADPRIRRAEDLIAADPGAPHTVRSLAESVALSPSRFAHLFTEQLGHSPMRALGHARLRHAARLLEATELTVERVAAASGFGSPFHFSRVFRRRYGVPPGEYRQQLRDGH
ncbi:helix-turn-helix domain-containing protein [Streptomyces stelliscabiei]|uniref:helix-turn-helix domain-containing protein n=1 Tax=Streptomyces stelliscabiei TaxID=146820 RepID=UPI00062C8B21|nr:helix-turn-helix domain-containing protein [Streptomyces stelliscabiei]KND42646.1 AraC family transcriptional regulator [Streptomyces stelliscabiei]MDX2514312.1 helix-turn-helix domain-containing protein [Streptomyces stelliscabiei]MDX2552423.1 helix-turn-helix domain-containing protein [Streptomyces stelliscabiei]MDX2611818.1 helix-turn-helix domain-containing protein [Streptomyces stelliscabiei]MDX2637166.1 helix-turn-helix domain-containing protein [Streptomyces stelliscabiei]